MPNSRRSESKQKKITQYYISRKVIKSFSKEWQRGLNQEPLAPAFEGRPSFRERTAKTQANG